MKNKFAQYHKLKEKSKQVRQEIVDLCNKIIIRDIVSKKYPAALELNSHDMEGTATLRAKLKKKYASLIYNEYNDVFWDSSFSDCEPPRRGKYLYIPFVTYKAACNFCDKHSLSYQYSILCKIPNTGYVHVSTDTL